MECFRYSVISIRDQGCLTNNLGINGALFSQAHLFNGKQLVSKNYTMKYLRLPSVFSVEFMFYGFLVDRARPSLFKKQQHILGFVHVFDERVIKWLNVDSGVE
jgi:hypothetical protein